ncbi:MAG: cytochrome c oxidase subunit II [Propionicimonas sp.]|nr:cytochrome c oxidase subunit II [Propionicimonas sp.]MEA5118316.1 cytochrome c oxidase subunit II [Propionicimonas sp.]
MLGLAGAGLLALSGCSSETAEQWTRWGLPEAASDRAPFIGNLWSGAWIASMVVGVFVWGLIGWVIIRYRRKHADEAPRQSRYNLPLELLYTLVPFLIIGVLFFFTVQAQNGVLRKEANPDHTVNVVGQKWSWTFNYMEADNPAVGAIVHEKGTPTEIPDLYLPVDRSVRFNLVSADVIHSFWIPDFYFKLDVIPGHPNSFDVTPTKLGDFTGRCAELCGTYHAAMIFNVHVVTEEEFVAKVNELKADPQNIGEITAPVYPNTVPTVPATQEHGS